MDFKEDIECARIIFEDCAGEFLPDDILSVYKEDTERVLREESENNVDYYIISSGGPIGLIGCINGGDTLEIKYVMIIKSMRRKGFFKKVLSYISSIYDPVEIKANSYGRSIPAFDMTGFEQVNGYYWKKV